MNDETKKMIDLLKEVMGWHRNPNSLDYNECEITPCMWCESAQKLIDKAHQTDINQTIEIEKFKAVQPADEET